MRKDIARNLGTATFEDSFHVICGGEQIYFSQFDIMFNYLWYNRRDEYFWHIAAVENDDFERVRTKKTMWVFACSWWYSNA